MKKTKKDNTDIQPTPVEVKSKPVGRQIAAFTIISVSEILEIFPTYTDEWADDPSNEAIRNEILFKFGADITKPIEIQDHLTHRNRLGKVVLCRRYACHERTDQDWLNSGFASAEVKNKVTGNRLLVDLNPLAYKEE